MPPYSVCEEKKCVDVATSDSSMLAPDCTDWTSGDQCKVMCTAGSVKEHANTEGEVQTGTTRADSCRRFDGAAWEQYCNAATDCCDRG